MSMLLNRTTNQLSRRGAPYLRAALAGRSSASLATSPFSRKAAAWALPTRSLTRLARPQQQLLARPVNSAMQISRRELATSPLNAYAAAQSSAQAGYRVAGALAAAGLGALMFYGYSSVENDLENDTFYSNRIRYTYAYLAGGLGITAASAVTLFRSGLAYRLMGMNPWVLMGTSLVGTIGTMLWTRATPYENAVSKHVAFTAFSAFVGATFCPLGMMYSAPLVMKAAAATGVVVGSLSAVAAAAPDEKFLAMGGPLAIGLGVVLAASVGSMFFPASRLLHNAWLYGGTGLFGLFVLYDTQRVSYNAKHQPQFDPINNCIGLYMDTINLFVRILTIMGGSNRK